MYKRNGLGGLWWPRTKEPRMGGVNWKLMGLGIDGWGKAHLLETISFC